MNTLDTIREFKTAHFTVIMDAVEDYDMDLSWDETGEVLQKLKTGEYIGFAARCRVIHDKLGEIGIDYLGGCIYSTIAEFQDHRECKAQTRKNREAGRAAICGSYFSDMIASAISEARTAINTAQHIYIRL